MGARSAAAAEEGGVEAHAARCEFLEETRHDAGGGEAVSGSLVTVTRDPSGDDEERPLKMTVTPTELPEPEKVGVVAEVESGEESGEDEDGADDAPPSEDSSE